MTDDELSKFRSDMGRLGAEMGKVGAAELEALKGRVGSYLCRGDIVPLKIDNGAAAMTEERQRSIRAIYDAFNLSGEAPPPIESDE